MNSYLKGWSEHKRSRSKKKPKANRRRLNMNKINLSSETCIKSWENNSSELDECVKTSEY